MYSFISQSPSMSLLFCRWLGVRVPVSPRSYSFSRISSRTFSARRGRCRLNRSPVVDRGSEASISSSAADDKSTSRISGDTTTTLEKRGTPSPVRIWEFYGSVVDGTTEHGRTKISLYEALPPEISSTSPGKAVGWKEVGIPKRSTGKEMEGTSASDDTRDNVPVQRKIDLYAKQQVQRAIKHFLPHGYPYTVAAGYARYITYQFGAGVAGSAAMVLSTQALLHAVGLSSNSAIPLAAGINWVIKDGIGQLGGIVFASRLGKTRGFDTNPKRWRVMSALAMDGATLLEICSPLVPGYFLLVASVANVGKNIGFLSASASKAALHQALMGQHGNNLADVTAKSGSQAIAASLLGTAVGVGISPWTGGGFEKVALGFVVLSAIHQGCTYLSLRAVALRNLNRHRMHLVLDHFVQAVNSSCPENETGKSLFDPDGMQDRVLSPSDVARNEVFFPFVQADDSHRWLKVGCRLHEVCPDVSTFQHLHKPEEKYILHCMIQNDSKKRSDETSEQLPSFGRGEYAKGKAAYEIRLSFFEGACGDYLIRGMLHAYLARSYIEGRTPAPSFEVNEKAYNIMLQTIDLLLMQLKEKGWQTDTEFVSIEPVLSHRLMIYEDAGEQEASC